MSYLRGLIELSQVIENMISSNEGVPNIKLATNL
jgi:hypothetical protein